MEKIIVYSDEFEDFINDLVDILYEQDYFGFEESAMNYGAKIYDFIFENIDLPITKNSPSKLQKFGKKYLKYKANHQTTWYIFFNQKGNRFLVNYITNNHAQNFPELL